MDLLSIRPFVHSTNCLLNLLSIQPFFHSTYDFIYLLSTRLYLYSTFCPFNLLSISTSNFCQFDLSFIQSFPFNPQFIGPYYTLNVVYLRFCHSSYSLFAHLSISTFIDSTFYPFQLLYYRPSLCPVDLRSFLHSTTNRLLDHLSIQPYFSIRPFIFLSTCCPLDLIYIQYFVHSSCSLFDLLPNRSFSHSLLSVQISVHSIFFFYLRFCPFSIFHVRPLVHFTIRATVLSIIWQFKLISSGPFTILPIVYLTFCPFSHFFIRPFFYTTFCSFGLLFIRSFVIQSCPFNPPFHSTYFVNQRSSIRPFLHSIFCPLECNVHSIYFLFDHLSI